MKIAIGVTILLLVLVGVNVVITDAETKPAEVTVPGGRIVSLPAGEVQVVERGPREASAIVLVHCFTCSIDWWSGMIPLLAREHRVVAIDLRGHGGSEKPSDGYTMPAQANLLAEALGRLGVRNAEVVGHSLGGPISIALAERSPQLVDRLVIMDSGPDPDSGDLGLIGELPFKPVIGQTLWRIKPDFSIEDGLEVAFAPGFPVPDEFVEDVKRMTYSAYNGSHDGFDDYASERPLPDRLAAVDKPTLAIMGAEEQLISDPEGALAAYRAAGARTQLILGAGHSPNVEKPAQTAAIVLAFQPDKKPAKRAKAGEQMQAGVQKPDGVRTRP
jgi:pimeloyl-ACP methyl ester carboxylesterase